MPYASEEAQAAASKAWYEANKELVLRRKKERMGAYRNLRDLIVAESMSRWVHQSEIVEACKQVERQYHMQECSISDRLMAEFTNDIALVGMLGGAPPFKRGTDAFEALREAIAKPYRKRIPIELFILNLQIEQIKKDHPKWIRRNFLRLGTPAESSSRQSSI